MNRERSMQRLNLLTLAAFLLGLGAFVFDAATPRAATFTAETVAWNAGDKPLSLN